MNPSSPQHFNTLAGIYAISKFIQVLEPIVVCIN